MWDFEQVPVTDEYNLPLLSTCFSECQLKVFSAGCSENRSIYVIENLSEFRLKLEDFCKKRQERLPEFLSQLSQLWNDLSIFQRALQPLAYCCSKGIIRSKDNLFFTDFSLIRVLSSIPAIQDRCFQLLVLKLSEIETLKMDCLTKVNVTDLQEKILDQMRFQPIVFHSNELARNLVELFSSSSESLQKRILLALPDILDDDGHELAAKLVLKVIPHYPSLLNQVLECFSSMSLSKGRITAIFKQLSESMLNLSLEGFLELLLMAPNSATMEHIILNFQTTCFNPSQNSISISVALDSFIRRLKLNLNTRQNLIQYFTSSGKETWSEVEYYLVLLLYSVGEKKYIMSLLLKKNWSETDEQTFLAAIYNLISAYHKLCQDICSLTEQLACCVREEREQHLVILMFFKVFDAVGSLGESIIHEIEPAVCSLIRLVERYPSPASDIGLLSILHISRDKPQVLGPFLNPLLLLLEYLENFSEMHLRYLFEILTRVLYTHDLSTAEASSAISTLAILVQKDLCHIEAKNLRIGMIALSCSVMFLNFLGIIGACANIELVPSLFLEKHSEGSDTRQTLTLRFFGKMTFAVLKEVAYFMTCNLYSVEGKNYIFGACRDVFEQHFNIQMLSENSDSDELSSTTLEDDLNSNVNCNNISLKQEDIDICTALELYTLLTKCPGTQKLEKQNLELIFSSFRFHCDGTASKENIKKCVLAVGFARISIIEIIDRRILNLHFKQFLYLLQYLMKMENSLSSLDQLTENKIYQTLWEEIPGTSKYEGILCWRTFLPRFSLETLYTFCELVFEYELWSHAAVLLPLLQSALSEKLPLAVGGIGKEFDEGYLHRRYHGATFCFVTLCSFFSRNSRAEVERDLWTTTLYLAGEACWKELRNKTSRNILLSDNCQCLKLCSEHKTFAATRHESLTAVEKPVRKIYVNVLTCLSMMDVCSDSKCLEVLIRLLDLLWEMQQPTGRNERSFEICEVMTTLQANIFTEYLDLESKRHMFEIFLKHSKEAFFEVISYFKELLDTNFSAAADSSRIAKIASGFETQTLKQVILGLCLEQLDREIKLCQQTSSSDDNSDQKLWRERLNTFWAVFNTFRIVLEKAKKDAKLKDMRFCLKQGQKFVRIVLDGGGLEVLAKQLLREKSFGLSLIKELQKCTRSLHQICAFCKESKEEALLPIVATVKKQLEALLFRVKQVLRKEGISNAFWLGNLKNKNFEGVALPSQIEES
eukprot:jgi/Galph1/449/GphlegSOOS_G5178.1